MSTNLLAKVLSESLERGIAQGRAAGHADWLRRYLVQRFGVIPPALEERIAAADDDTLTALFDHAVMASTIESLTSGLRQQ